MIAEYLHLRRKNAFLMLLLSYFVGATDAWCHQCTRRRLSKQSLFIVSTKAITQDDSVDENYYTLPRLYVGPTVRLGDGVHFALSPEQAHYVTKVMRVGTKKSRDSVRVFDGVNGEWLAQIHVEEEEDGHRKRKRRDDLRITARCTLQLRPQDTSNSLTEPWLFFAPIKKQRVKIMLEKCTELGVGRFVPILTERADPSSVRDVYRDIDKLAAQAVEASEQCERLKVPPLSICVSDGMECEEPWDLPMLLTEWSTNDVFREKHLLICRERTADGSVPVLKLLESLYVDDNMTVVAFAIGPEGGWSPAEEALCDQYTSSCRRNIHCVSLGSLVLRAETAAIAAVSAYMVCQDIYYNHDNMRATS